MDSLVIPLTGSGPTYWIDSRSCLVIYTTKGDASVCLCAKFDQFLPVRSHFDTKHPVNFFHIATFPSPTFGPLFAFHCPLFFYEKQ